MWGTSVQKFKDSHAVSGQILPKATLHLNKDSVNRASKSFLWLASVATMFISIVVPSWPFKDFRSVQQIVPNRECKLRLRSCMMFLHCLFSNMHPLAHLAEECTICVEPCSCTCEKNSRSSGCSLTNSPTGKDRKSANTRHKFLGSSRLFPSKQLICQIQPRLQSSYSPGQHAREMTSSCLCVLCAKPQISGVHYFKNYRFWKFPALYQSERTEVQALNTCTCFRADWSHATFKQMLLPCCHVPRYIRTYFCAKPQISGVHYFKNYRFWESAQQNKIMSKSIQRHAKTNLMVHWQQSCPPSPKPIWCARPQFFAAKGAMMKQANEHGTLVAGALALEPTLQVWSAEEQHSSGWWLSHPSEK